MNQHKIYLILLIFFFSVTHAEVRVPKLGSTEHTERCKKLGKVYGYLENNKYFNSPSTEKMEEALKLSGINPDQEPIIWGLPLGRFGDLFSTYSAIKEYQNEIQCGLIKLEKRKTISNVSTLKCLEKTEDQFDLSNFNKYRKYTNGLLEFMPIDMEIINGNGFVTFSSNSKAFNKKHIINNHILSIDELNFCPGIILSMKCRFGFYSRDCIIRQNEEVLAEEIPLKKLRRLERYNKPKSSRESVNKDCLPTWYEGEDIYCANKGNSEGMIQIVENTDLHGIKINTLKLENFVNSAEELVKRQSPQGFYALGYMYNNALGKPYNPQLGYHFTKKAADENHPKAFEALGNMYLSGIGVERDITKARKAFQRGLKFGDHYTNFTSLLNNLDRDVQRYKNDKVLWQDFMNILERGTGKGYIFKNKIDNITSYYEELGNSSVGSHLFNIAIDALGEMKSHADLSVALMVKKYPALSSAKKSRIRLALRHLGHGTPEAVKLMADEALSLKSKELSDYYFIRNNLHYDALLTLATFGSATEPLINRIKPLLNSPNRYTRLLSMTVIGEIGKKELLPLIQHLSGDASPMVRLEAGRYISKLSK